MIWAPHLCINAHIKSHVLKVKLASIPTTLQLHCLDNNFPSVSHWKKHLSHIQIAKQHFHLVFNIFYWVHLTSNPRYSLCTVSTCRPDPINPREKSVLDRRRSAESAEPAAAVVSTPLPSDLTWQRHYHLYVNRSLTHTQRGIEGAECLSKPSTSSSHTLTGEITTASELAFSIRDTCMQNRESFIRRGLLTDVIPPICRTHDGYPRPAGVNSFKCSPLSSGTSC